MKRRFEFEITDTVMTVIIAILFMTFLGVLIAEDIKEFKRQQLANYCSLDPEAYSVKCIDIRKEQPNEK